MTITRLIPSTAVLALAVVAAACGGPAGAAPAASPGAQAPSTASAPVAAATMDATEAPAGTSGSGGASHAPMETGTTGSGLEPTPAPAQVEGWRGVILEDARTGAAFTIADHAGRLVAIEPMAAWCSKCLAQQREARKALEQVAGDGVVYISLGVDPSEKAKELQAYADDHGFDWTFAVAPKELSRELAAEFGDQVLSPPSVPFILVGADGTVIEQHFGSRGADELAALLSQHLP